MGFNEKTHAFLVARYYGRLTERFAQRGKAAFIHAVQYYAGQRGRRMAQRAIRDGRPLTHAVFLQYGELRMTDEVGPTRREVVEISPDYELHITACPWHEQFREMGCLEAGAVYCRYIDEALCRGFSPDIDFRAPQNLNAGERCVQKVIGVCYEAPPDDPPMEAYKKNFDYHCGNLYWAFHEAVRAIFGAEGEELCTEVLGDFAGRYGAEMADALAAWRHTNFNVC
ncbi:MAG TPA: L-2-amino-thiazoline-4-carboxylic acid hydrolase [Candidatus Pullichristensenella avicola]|nr:L-2-amino-thiazoline-4-carboxylic acid hydrolase [Candidatus Pullichristensenella avicola]